MRSSSRGSLSSRRVLPSACSASGLRRRRRLQRWCWESLSSCINKPCPLAYYCHAICLRPIQSRPARTGPRPDSCRTSANRRGTRCSLRLVFFHHLGLTRDLREPPRSEEHTSELQSRLHLVCRLLLEKKKKSYTSGLVR